MLRDSRESEHLGTKPEPRSAERDIVGRTSFGSLRPQTSLSFDLPIHPNPPHFEPLPAPCLGRVWMVSEQRTSDPVSTRTLTAVGLHRTASSRVALPAGLSLKTLGPITTRTLGQFTHQIWTLDL